MPQRVFIDATYTLSSGRCSGVERVVRNLVRESQLSQLPNLPEAELIISQNQKFYKVSADHLKAFQLLAQTEANAVEHTSKLYRKLAAPFCNVSRSMTLRKWLLPQPGHLGIFKLIYRLRKEKLLASVTREAEVVEPDRKDLFILPDAYWVHRLRESVWPAARKAKDRGATVASVIYDLIPLTHPEFVGEKRRQSFHNYLTEAIKSSNSLLAISKTVQKQLEEFLVKHDPNREIETKSFQLGAKIADSDGPVRGEVQTLFSQPTTPYLVVASFDPRKNHAYVLDAFDQLWNSGSKAKLCLVGRIGSRCNETVARILRHPLLNKRLFLFEDLADPELYHCYQKSRGVIFPSIVEGYGLPIVESLWHGKQTFVSDTTIHREIGGAACRFFSLKDCKSLATGIDAWEHELRVSQDPQLLLNDAKRAASRNAVSWEKSWRQLVSTCLGQDANASKKCSLNSSSQ